MTAQTIQDVVGGAAMLLGVALFVLAGIGLIRFRDPYTRLAAVTKSGTLGICLLLLGVLVVEPSVPNAVKLLLAIALQLMTSPVGGFALGRAAFRADVPLPEGTQYDELHGADESGPVRRRPDPPEGDVRRRRGEPDVRAR